MRAATLLLCALFALALRTRTAAAEPAETRIAILVGANLGDGNDEPLRYAESDVRAMRELLIELGGVAPERAMLLIGGGPTDVLRLITEARGRAAELTRSGGRVVLLFYFSGHGDGESLHLPRGHLSYRDLTLELRRIPSELRLTLIDACRLAGHAKGVHRGPEFRLSTGAEAQRGEVELWASSIGEVAAESDQLSGAVFTHYVLSALRGGADLDGDGAVTLGELYAHVYRRTMLATSGELFAQHPAMRIDLAGSGELVLSRPRLASATIELPRGGDRYLVFLWPSASVIAELGPDGPRKLGLPAGRYLISERRGDRHRVAQIDLPWGGTTRLAAADFRAVSREELARKGGRLELHAARLEPRIGLEAAPGAAAPWSLWAGVAAGWARGALDLELEAAYVQGGLATPAFRGDQRSLVGAPLIGVRGFWKRATFRFLMGPELRHTWQVLQRVEAARAAGAGIATTEVRTGSSIGPRARLQLAVALGKRVSATLNLSASALVGRAASGTGTAALALQPVLSAALGGAYAF
ncbi:MAG: caspase family protein [Polyangia bacterium]